jgi:hypothetical protein
MKISLHEMIKPSDTKRAIALVRTSYLVTPQRPSVRTPFGTKECEKKMKDGDE